MKFQIGQKKLISVITIMVAGIAVGVFLLHQEQPVGRGYNTVIASSSTDQNIPPIGACTGPLGQSKQRLLAIQTEKLGQVPAVLEQLDSLTISCNGPDDIMKLPDTFTSMGGQCCGALTNLTEYKEQIDGLKKFSYIPDVPPNPYNISVQHVKKMLA